MKNKNIDKRMKEVFGKMDAMPLDEYLESATSEGWKEENQILQPNQFVLTKTKYCRGLQCPKILWMDKNMPEKAVKKSNDSVLENGTRVGELARQYFGEYKNVEFNSDLNKMVEDTQKYIKEGHKIITEASFAYNNCFCSIDILKVDDDGFEIYEVKSSTEVKKIYKEDVAFQHEILGQLGYSVKGAYIMYINKNYIRQGNLDLKELFVIEKEPLHDISKSKEIMMNTDIFFEFVLDNEKEPVEKLDLKCKRPYECDYWEYCSRNLPPNNVFDIHGMKMKDKFKYLNNGNVEFDSLLKQDINWKHKQQIEIDKTNEQIINEEEIKKFMKELTYPLYFLDFETYQKAVPEYDGTWPYEQITFQYSLHYIESENGELKHKEYLAEAGKDPRRELAERLVRDIPVNVCVTAYNMGFEKGRIKELANLYPDLKEHLMNIHDNIKDLMIPFFKRWYYVKDMQGSYSIKYVLPALFPNDPSLNYHNLPLVHNGGEASSTFISMSKYSKEEQQEIRKGLLVYCELDTYAMVKIWKKLKEI